MVAVHHGRYYNNDNVTSFVLRCSHLGCIPQSVSTANRSNAYMELIPKGSGRSNRPDWSSIYTGLFWNHSSKLGPDRPSVYMGAFWKMSRIDKNSKPTMLFGRSNFGSQTEVHLILVKFRTVSAQSCVKKA